MYKKMQRNGSAFEYSFNQQRVFNNLLALVDCNA